MKILLTGGTGLVGQNVAKKLIGLGHEIVVITRSSDKKIPYPCDVVVGDLGRSPIDRLPKVQAVVHLMGESVAEGRWTAQKKKEIYDSRIVSTRNLRESLKGQTYKLVSASAIGYYPLSDGNDITEASGPGSDFLSKVCVDWESEVRAASSQWSIIRIGIVLSKEGGALKKMLPAFKLGLGGPLGTGEQWMSWIHIDDLSEMIVWSLGKSGVFNGVAPQPVTNRDFSRTLSAALRRPLGPRVPRFVLKMALGEMADFVLGSQKIFPQRTLGEGFKFRYPDLVSALKQLFPREN